MTCIQMRSALLLLLSVVSFPAGAAEWKAKGNITYSVTERPQTLLGEELIVLEQTGTIDDADPASPIDGNAQYCNGTVARSGAAVSGHGTCVAGDEDGDVWWLSWSSGGTGSQWIITGGTGKFKGATGSGTTMSVPGQDGKPITSYDGTIALK